MGKIFTVTILLVLLVLGGLFYWKYYFTYSDGNRTGFLQKFSHKGNAFKTYEGELVLNSINTNGMGPLSTEKFYFSVEDKGVATQLAGMEGRKVVVHYQEKKGTLFWRGDSKYIVNDVRPAE